MILILTKRSMQLMSNMVDLTGSLGMAGLRFEMVNMLSGGNPEVFKKIITVYIQVYHLHWGATIHSVASKLF